MPIPFTRDILESQTALASAEAAHGPEHESLIPLLKNLASLCWAQGMDILAWQIQQRIDTIQTKGLGLDHPAVVAIRLRGSGERIPVDAETKERLEDQLRTVLKKTGFDSPAAALLMAELADVYAEGTSEKEMRRVIELRERALAIRTTTHGPEHPETAEAMLSLAWSLGGLDEPANLRQETILRSVLALQEKLYGADSPELKPVLWALQCYFDNAEKGRRDYAQAIVFCCRTLEIDVKTFGPDHLQVADDLGSVARLLQKIGNNLEARKLLTHARAIREKNYGRDNLLVARCLTDLADVEDALGNADAAEKMLDEVVSIQLRFLGVSEEALYGWTEVEHRAKARKDTAKREACHRQYLEACERAYGPEDERTTSARVALEMLKVEQNCPDELSEEYHRGRIAVFERIYGPEHKNVVDALVGLRAYLSNRMPNKTAECEEVDRQIKTITHKRLASELRHTAEVVEERGQYEEAEALFQDSLDVYTEYDDPVAKNRVLDSLVRCCERRGDKDAALKFQGMKTIGGDRQTR